MPIAGNAGMTCLALHCRPVNSQTCSCRKLCGQVLYVLAIMPLSSTAQVKSLLLAKDLDSYTSSESAEVINQLSVDNRRIHKVDIHIWHEKTLSLQIQPPVLIPFLLHSRSCDDSWEHYPLMVMKLMATVSRTLIDRSDEWHCKRPNLTLWCLEACYVLCGILLASAGFVEVLTLNTYTHIESWVVSKSWCTVQ